MGKKKKVLSFVSVFQMLGTERATCGPGLGLPEHPWEEASPPGLQEGEGITAPRVQGTPRKHIQPPSIHTDPVASPRHQQAVSFQGTSATGPGGLKVRGQGSVQLRPDRRLCQTPERWGDPLTASCSPPAASCKAGSPWAHRAPSAVRGQRLEQKPTGSGRQTNPVLVRSEAGSRRRPEAGTEMLTRVLVGAAPKPTSASKSKQLSLSLPRPLLQARAVPGHRAVDSCGRHNRSSQPVCGLHISGAQQVARL